MAAGCEDGGKAGSKEGWIDEWMVFVKSRSPAEAPVVATAARNLSLKLMI